MKASISFMSSLSSISSFISSEKVSLWVLKHGVSAAMVLMVLVVGLAGLAAPTRGATPEAIEVETAMKVIEAKDAWIRETPPTAKVAALYFTLMNTGGEAEVLTGLRVENVGRAVMHRSVMDLDKGVTRMMAVAEIEIPAHGEIRFEPGSFHGMLSGFESGPPRANSDVKVTFELKRAGVISTVAKVVRGMPSMAGEHNGHGNHDVPKKHGMKHLHK